MPTITDPTIKRLHAEGRSLSDQNKALLDEATKRGEKTGMSTEERARYDELFLTADERKAYDERASRMDRIDEAIDTFAARLDRDERAAKRAAELGLDADDDTETGHRAGTTEDLGKRIAQFVAGEIRSVKFGYTAAQAREARATVTKTTTANAVAPTDFVAAYLQSLVDDSNLENNLGFLTFTTSSGRQRTWSREGILTDAAWIDEGTTITQLDPTWAAPLVTSPWKLAGLLSISDEAEEDAAPDLDVAQFWTVQAGKAIARTRNLAFMSGNGTKKPRGLLTDATVGVTKTAGASIGVDDIYDLEASMVEAHLVRAKWVMKRTTLADLRKLKDTAGNYLLRDPLVAGAPKVLSDHEVVTDPNMPSNAVGNKPIMLVNGQAYLVHQVGQVRFDSSPDFAFDVDKMTHRVITRVDAKLYDVGGAKVISRT